MRKFYCFIRNFFITLALFVMPVSAQEKQKIIDYLDEVNYQSVSFEGEITYDKSEDIFRVIINGNWFSAVLDAGRETRELIQEACLSNSMFNLNWCKAVGDGTIEIRGSNIWLSIENVKLLD